MNDALLVDSHGRRLALGATTTAIVWTGETAWFALGDGRLRAVSFDGDARDVTAHDGAILCAARHPGGCGVVTGGDDGRLMLIGEDGFPSELGRFGTAWVGHVVVSAASGVIVAGIGKEAVVWTAGSTAPSHRVAYASTVGGLALDAKGKRLAATHYGGATLTYAAMPNSGRIQLDWVGSHLACTLSPDGNYLITALQETGLHGWRLPMAGHMRMEGYDAKTRSFSWSRRGKWLATSGDGSVIVWPFAGKTGPVGKAPTLVGKVGALVTQVAFHPVEDLIAVGYAHGAVSLTRLGDDGHLVIREDNGSAVSALGWSERGGLLAWGDEDGAGGLLDMRKRA